MSVEITTENWVSGMPTLDYKIHINGVVIALQEEQFMQLVSKLREEIGSDLEKALQVKKEFNKDVEKLREFREEILEIFYGDLGTEGDLLFKRKLKDIDEKRLAELLDKYDGFLGIE